MRAILLTILLSILGFSCATHHKTVQVPVELPYMTYYKDVRIRDMVLMDSVSRWSEGDTVYIYREKTKVLNISDTLISKDSISKAVILESVDELNIEYLDKISELKSLLFRILSP